MKIPQGEIDAVKTFCENLKELITAYSGPVADLPLSVVSNPFPLFAWLKYHPALSLGGTPLYFTGDKIVVIYDYTLKQLVWFNGEDTGPASTGGAGVIKGWHPITADREEIIEVV